MGRPDVAKAADRPTIPGIRRPAGWLTVAQVAVVAMVIGIANVLVGGDAGGDAGTTAARPLPDEPALRTPEEAVGGASGNTGSTATDSEIIKDEIIPTWT